MSLRNQPPKCDYLLLLAPIFLITEGKVWLPWHKIFWIFVGNFSSLCHWGKKAVLTKWLSMWKWMLETKLIGRFWWNVWRRKPVLTILCIVSIYLLLKVVGWDGCGGGGLWPPNPENPLKQSLRKTTATFLFEFGLFECKSSKTSCSKAMYFRTWLKWRFQRY